MTLTELRSKAIEALSPTPSYRAADEVTQEHLILTWMDGHQAGERKGYSDAMDAAYLIIKDQLNK